MSIKALQGITPVWWSPKSETTPKPDGDGKKDPNPAAFFLKPLTGPEMLEVQEYFDFDNGSIKTPGLLLACRLGLADWRNIEGPDDDMLVFKDIRKPLDVLAAETLAIVGAQIIASSVLAPDAEKNSLSQSK